MSDTVSFDEEVALPTKQSAASHGLAEFLVHMGFVKTVSQANTLFICVALLLIGLSIFIVWSGPLLDTPPPELDSFRVMFGEMP